MGVLNTLAVGLYAALLNVVGALVVGRLLPEGYAIGVTLVDAIIAMLAAHGSSTIMILATSVLVAIVAIVAKILANVSVKD